MLALVRSGGRVASRARVRAPVHALLRTSLPPAHFCDSAERKAAEEAARHAIAAAERMSGELSAAEAAGQQDRDPRDAEPATDAAPSSLRFPLGALVECACTHLLFSAQCSPRPPAKQLSLSTRPNAGRLGEGRWATGTVVGHRYREKDWPAERVAPYQVQLGVEAEGGSLIFAPQDIDECSARETRQMNADGGSPAAGAADGARARLPARAVRSALRFPLGAQVECFLDGEWARGVVVAHYHREPSWPPSEWAPYQIELADGPHGHAPRTRIYAPVDTDECVRAPAVWPWPGSRP